MNVLCKNGRSFADPESARACSKAMGGCSKCVGVPTPPKPKPVRKDIFANVVWPDPFTNPMLLSVKMFLADIRPWVRQYKDGQYVCSDFAQDVCKAATERTMRCGYVVISFQNSVIGHAIVAFQTDHGLVFIEPQEGEQIELSIGKRYPLNLDGVPEGDTITSIVIRWNDGTQTEIAN